MPLVGALLSARTTPQRPTCPSDGDDPGPVNKRGITITQDYTVTADDAG